jgi:hypothetical protein
MPSGARRRAFWFGTLWLVAWTATLAPAQEPGVRTLYHRSLAFRIPVTITEDAREQVREVRLWVSDDLGYSWRDHARTTPQRPEFPFKAPRDGEYWFAVQTLDKQGRVYPSDDRTVEPSLKVVVDTVPPVLVLEARGRRGSELAVAWEMEDPHLVPGSFLLEYQVEGARAEDWRSVPLRSDEVKNTGSKLWDAGTADAVRVRGTVKDRAGNARTVELTIGDGLAMPPGVARSDGGRPPRPITPVSQPSSASDLGEDDPFAPTSSRPANPSRNSELDEGEFDEVRAAPPAPGDVTEPTRTRTSADAPTILAGSTRFPLKYEVEDAGPGGPALVELWITRDGGRSWSRQPPDADRTSPYIVDVGGEGTFGLWLVVQGSSGLGDLPPAPGDRPQLWVEVDATPPVVQLDAPKVGGGPSAGKVMITWRASDPHLASKPVVLLYRADAADAAWQPITERIANTGKYIWTVPTGVPPRFHVRIEVVDALGHKGSAETTDQGPPVIVDRSRPRGRILGLDPSARFGSEERMRQ